MKKIINKYSIILLILINTSLAKSLELDGDFIQGGFIVGKTEINSKVKLDNKDLLVNSDGVFIFGFGRNHPRSSYLEVVIGNKKTSKKIFVKQRKYLIQRIDKLDPKKVTPPKSYYDRIISDIKKVKKAKNRKVSNIYFESGFVWPVKGIITGVYGSQRILNGVKKRPHYGIDIANKEGKEIVSTSDGIVVLAERDLYFSGGTIIIAHGQGLTSSYLHLSELHAKVGDSIEKGQLIGKLGSTGRATGPHLDWRMEVNGIRIDPALLVEDLKL